MNLERRPKTPLTNLERQPKAIVVYFLLGGLPAEPGVDGGPLFDPPSPTVSDAGSPKVSDAGSPTLALLTSLASMSTSFSAALVRKRMKPVDNDIMISLG